jgi:2-dehydro-3-deoxygalactonokinase
MCTPAVGSDAFPNTMMASNSNHSTSPTEWVMVDWGTTSLRGALLNAQGEVLQERAFAQGILSVPAGGFAAVFAQRFGDWMSQPHRRCLISGMAGSRQGWQEAPYCPCPAGFAEIAAHLLWLQPGRIALVPGLSCVAQDALHTPDVMRGEEVQIWGALQLAKRHSATLVLPGTHSKWVRVANGRVTDFKTYMTGEVFALLSQHSILAKTLDLNGAFEAATFLQGVDHSQQGASLLHTLFAVRTLGLFERLSAAALPSYLSGLLIGEELRGQAVSPPAGPVLLIGSEALTLRYTLALQHLNIASQSFGAQATWAGLFALACACFAAPSVNTP